MTEYPGNYSWLINKYDKVMKAHQDLGRELSNAGPISEKNAQLIKLAAAAAVRSEGAVHSHSKRALKAGAQPDEIFHSLILLTSTIGFPAVAAAISWIKDTLEAD